MDFFKEFSSETRQKNYNTKVINNQFWNQPIDMKDDIHITELKINKCNMNNIRSFPPNLKKITLSQNNVTSFDMSIIPRSVTEIIYKNESTETLTGDLPPGLELLSINNTQIEILDIEIPDTLSKLDLSGNKGLCVLPDLTKCSGLKNLDVRATFISCIDNIPDSVEILDTCLCSLNHVNKLPSHLLVWKSWKASLSEIRCKFPENVNELDFYMNNLKILPELPKTILILDVASNDLTLVPYFPDTVKSVDLRNNKKMVIPDEIIKMDTSDKKILFDTVHVPASSSQHVRGTNTTQERSIDIWPSKEYSTSNPNYILHADKGTKIFIQI